MEIDAKRKALFEALEADLRARGATEEEREIAYSMARALDLSSLDEDAVSVRH